MSLPICLWMVLQVLATARVSSIKLLELPMPDFYLHPIVGLGCFLNIILGPWDSAQGADEFYGSLF